MVSCKHCGKNVPQNDPKLGGRPKLYCNHSCRGKWRYNNTDYKQRNTYDEQKTRGRNKKEKAIQLKGGCCTMCGESRYSVLCFHHVDPSIKSFRLDARSFANRRWEVLEDELNKCQLLCQNCHHDLHYG